MLLFFYLNILLNNEGYFSLSMEFNEMFCTYAYYIFFTKYVSYSRTKMA